MPHHLAPSQPVAAPAPALARASGGRLEHFGPHDPGRAGIEAFIADAFLKTYGARISHFCDTLVGCRDDPGHWTAALGYPLGGLLGEPVDLFAGIGFIAVFAGATNTPLACTVMGLELFGAHHAVYFALACFIAYYCSGHLGIYLSQRVGVPKRRGATMPPEMSLRETRDVERR